MNKVSNVLILFLFCVLGCQQKVIVSPPPQKFDYPITYLSQEEQIPANIQNSKTQSKSTEQVSVVIDLIVVKISEQKLYVYQSGNLLRQITVSTAEGDNNILGISEDPESPHNHLGEFSVYLKDKNHYSQQYNCQMPYSLFFYKGHGIHATTANNYSKLGTPASHGCVRTNLEDVKWLFEHTPLGTKIIIEP